MNPALIMDGKVEAFKGVFYQYGKHQTLWFIASLYVYSLLFYWVDKVCKNHSWLLAGCILLIILGQLVVFVLRCPMMPLKMNYSFWAIAIMGFGKLYKAYEYRIDAMIMSWKIAIATFLLFVYLIYETGVSINYFGNANWFLAVVIPLTGLHWMLYLSKHIMVNVKPLLFIGANSLVYFALHRQVLNAVEGVTKKVMAAFSLEPSFFSNLLEVVVIAALIVVPVWLINKYIPQVTGKGWKLWKS